MQSYYQKLDENCTSVKSTVCGNFISTHIYIYVYTQTERTLFYFSPYFSLFKFAFFIFFCLTLKIRAEAFVHICIQSVYTSTNVIPISFCFAFVIFANPKMPSVSDASVGVTNIGFILALPLMFFSLYNITLSTSRRYSIFIIIFFYVHVTCFII